MPRDSVEIGDGHDSVDIQGANAVSTPSAVRKSGRPRKAIHGLTPITEVPTGALNSETSWETAADGGHFPGDTQQIGAPATFTQIGSDAVAERSGHMHADIHVDTACSSAPISKMPSQKTAGGGQSAVDAHGIRASSSSNTAVSHTDGGSEVRAKGLLISNERLPDLTPIIDALESGQKKRTFLIRSKNRQINATLAFVRLYLNWDPDLPEKERKKIEARARSIVEKVEKGKPLPEEDKEIGQELAPLILASVQARAPIEHMLKAKGTGVEAHMEKLAKQLPVWMWAEGVRGFGASGLAIILGETGDISNYSNPGKLWKRLGLAPYAKGEQNKAASTWRMTGGLTSEEWKEVGYKPHRRSEMWNRGEPLLKAQIRQVKDADGNDTGEREVLGPYGQAYLDRKRYELERNPEMSKMHAHNRAARYMEKRLIKHLWQVWHRQTRTD